MLMAWLSNKSIENEGHDDVEYRDNMTGIRTNKPKKKDRKHKQAIIARKAKQLAIRFSGSRSDDQITKKVEAILNWSLYIYLLLKKDSG